MDIPLDSFYVEQNKGPDTKGIVMSDLDIFSGNDTAPSSIGPNDVRVPKIDEVETSIRTDKKKEGFASKITNLLGFQSVSEESKDTSQIKSDLDQMSAGLPEDKDGWGYSQVKPSAMRANISDSSSSGRPGAKYTSSKRYYLEKIGFYIRKLNEIRETKTQTEITVYNTLDEIKAEYDELRQEYKMASAILGYGKTIVEGAATLEAIGGFVDGFPLKTDGLENAIQLSMNDCSEEFEQIYERYGSIEINPLITVGASIISTIIKTHMAHSLMNMFGDGFADDPEINEIIQRRADTLGTAISQTSTANLMSAVKNGKAPEERPIQQEKSSTQFNSAFHFADQIIQNNSTNGGPPPPIHTKNVKPPPTEESANTIKQMAPKPERPPMKGPSVVPNADDFLKSLATTPPTPAPEPTESAPTGKKRGRKPATASTVSIDL